MNCLEFRRVLNTEPDSRDPEFLRHKNECDRCAAVAARSADFEQALKQAMKVEVPEDLSSRILLKQSFEKRRLQRRRWWQTTHAYALAASVILAVGLSVGLMFSNLGQDEATRELEKAIFARMAAEPYALTVSGNMDTGTVASILGQLGWKLDTQVDRAVQFGHVCAVGKQQAAHFTLDGIRGPVTVMLMPDREVDGPSVIEGDDLRGVLVPIEGGAMAVVGRPDEPIDPIAKEIRSKVRWTL